MTLVYPVVISTTFYNKKLVLKNNKLRYKYFFKLLFNLESIINKCNRLYITEKKTLKTQSNMICKSMFSKKKNERKLVSICKQKWKSIFDIIRTIKTSYFSSFLIMLLSVFYKIYKNSNFLNEVVFSSW